MVSRPSWIEKLRGSLFVRMVLIIGVALVAFILVFFAAFRSTLTFQIAPSVIDDLAEPIAEVVALIEDTPLSREQSILDVYSGPVRAAGVREEFPKDAEIREHVRQRMVDNASQRARLLADREIRFRYFSPRVGPRDALVHPRGQFRAYAALEISVELNDGRVLTFLFAPASVLIDRPRTLGGLLAISAVVIGGIAAAGIRRTLDPLKQLETAAERFGATFDPEPVEERGAEEIRRVARALNRTQDQVRGLIAERARLVTALAHDIRTSLTRLRLRIEQPGELNIGAMANDILQMRTLIDDMLTYAKSGDPDASKELVDLPDFIDQYTAAAPDGIPFGFGQDERGFVVAADPKALTRAMNNLVDNARTYGGGASIRCESLGDGFRIIVEDQGPGIPDDQLAKVFEPFFRLETSRNRQTGGSGLGLGIARGLVEAQGGTLTLENRQPTGLRAIISFHGSQKVT
ncbi:MAG: ATP-binding protein [Pseudomonadota bacterium]